MLSGHYRLFVGRESKWKLQADHLLSAMDRIAVFLLLVISLSHAVAWSCGNEGQCSCGFSGAVLCKEVAAAPFFASEHRTGKVLTIRPGMENFDVASLKRTIGFARVIVIGLSGELCLEITSTFPWGLSVWQPM